MLWPKKNSYTEFDNEKKFLRLENSPPPPHNFSNGRSLKQIIFPFCQLSFSFSKKKIVLSAYFKIISSSLC